MSAVICPVETLIIGAGVIGSSTAMHLGQKGMMGVRVVDLDLEGTLSSSELNAGGVRATWHHELNIVSSKITIDYFSKVASEVGYRDCGYLWMYSDPAKFFEALKARDLQIRLGWDVEALDVAALKKRAPFIDKTDDLVGAVFGVRDGLVNPNLVKQHFRKQARTAGVVFEDRVRVVGFEKDGSKIKVRALKYPPLLTEEEKLQLLTSGSHPAGEETIYICERVINCAGAWAPELAKLAGYLCPSYPVRRQVSIFDCRKVDLTPYGMMIDPSGVYFHPEATNGLAGFADASESRGKNFAYDGESFFMEKIWAPLYERASGFEELKHLTGWAGLYEVSPDESGIVGCVSEGECARTGQLFEAHSFSGHGVMHSYTAGLGLSELILKGRYETVDLAPLSGTRFREGKLVHEDFII